MPNFVRGVKVGSKAVQVSGAPFMFAGWLPRLKFQREGWALQWRCYEFTVYPWPL
jgi:hypothetical protein